VWHINNYFKLQGELGYDEVKPSTGGAVNEQTRKLTKFTIAPTIVAGGGFWARPELRLFYTYATWNDAARDLWGGVAGGTGGRFGSDTDGSTIGFQVEAWF
jgi:maltoporin